MKFFIQLLVFGSLSLCIQACHSTGQATANGKTKVATEAGDIEGSTFGAAFTPVKVLTYEQLIATATESDSLATTVRGTVADVCQMKGCWMNLVGADGSEMMVRFKDYGFFMPKDIAGREVIMNGKAFFQTTPVDELRHYAEDAGKTAEEIAKITEPKRELSFLADGVILLNE